MGLRKPPLVKFTKQQNWLDVWTATHEKFLLKVQPDSNGDWQWSVEDWSTGYHINHVIGTMRTQQAAEDRAVQWAMRRQ